MGLSKIELIKIILPAIFGPGGIAAIVIFLIPYLRRRRQGKNTQGTIVEKTKISGGGSILGKIENQGDMIYINNLNLIIGEEVSPLAPEETQKLIKEIEEILRKLLEKSIGGNKT